MSLLTQVLETLVSARGPVRIEDLARDLRVETSALEGMLDVLHRKGLLERPSVPLSSDSVICASGCGSSCRGMAVCPYVVGVPSGRPAAVAFEVRHAL